jgi:DNA-binding IclR family transcriptional regulator
MAEPLEAFAGGPRSVSDLARLIGAEHHLVSKHLSEMARVDVVVRRQDGNFAFYSVRPHSALGRKTPAAFAAAWTPDTRAA